MDEPPDVLFGVKARRIKAGRVRAGLEADVKSARTSEHELPAAGVATLRVLADHIDALERQLRGPTVRPRDRLPLAALHHQFDETYVRVFGAVNDSDEFDAALTAFRAAESRDAAAPRSPD